MENRSKAIILDMDETLEHGIFQGIYNLGDKYKNKVEHIGIKPSFDVTDTLIL